MYYFKSFVCFFFRIHLLSFVCLDQNESGMLVSTCNCTFQCGNYGHVECHRFMDKLQCVCVRLAFFRCFFFLFFVVAILVQMLSFFKAFTLFLFQFDSIRIMTIQYGYGYVRCTISYKVSVNALNRLFRIQSEIEREREK